MATSPRELLARTRHFLIDELWSQDLRSGGPFAPLIRSLQLAAMIARGFVEDKLLLRASALTYMSALSLIPILVVLLSIIQWLGLSRDLVVLGVNQFLAGSPDAIERIMDFVEGAQVGALGSVGGAVFLMTTVLSLRHVEATFDEIWGALKSRSWVRRFTNYLAVLVVVPLLVGSIVSVSSAVGGNSLAGRLNLEPVVDVAHGLLLGAGPLIFLTLAFSLAYLLLPNTRVRPLSAMLGGAVAGLLFVVAQYGYVSFSVGAARYDALFGGFAFVPLLLVWIYVSWAVVLLGAEVAYAHQNLARFRREEQERDVAPAEREAVALRLLLEVARRFRDCRPPEPASSLAQHIGSSLRVVSDVLDRFEQAGLVTACGDPDGEIAYQLGRPAEGLPVGEILSAVRGCRDADPEVGAEAACTFQRVEEVLEDADRVQGPVRDRVLAELLKDLPPAPGAADDG